MNMGKIYILPIAAAAGLFLLSSCGEESLKGPDDVNGKDITLTFGRADAIPLARNTVLAQFHSLTAGDGGYRGMPDLDYPSENSITFNLGEGSWDFRMVSANDEASLSGIMEPAFGKTAVQSLMWRAADNTAEAPEIYTSAIQNVEMEGHWEAPEGGAGVDKFVPDRDYRYPAQYTRNVAKLSLTFGKSEDLKPGGSHKVYISNVPRALNWAGGLYPDKNNPEINPTPLECDFNLITVDGEEERQIGTNTVEHLIPAHRGTDYANPATATDTTTSLLRLSVDLEAVDGSRIRKQNVVLCYAPKMNGVYNIEVSYNKRKLTVNTSIIPWKDENVNADIVNRSIVTDKAEVGLAWKDTIRIQSREPYTVTRAADASWLTLRDLGSNAWEITANTDTYVYGSPRSSYISIVSGLLEKRVPVTQRPENKGTIKAVFTNPGANESAKQCWLSPPHPNKAVRVTSIGGDWAVEDEFRTVPISGSAGVTNTAITRKDDQEIMNDDIDAAFGNGPVVFYNKRTLDTDTLWVDNLFIGARDDVIEIAQPTSRPDTTDLTNHVAVKGGLADVTIISLPSFIKAAGTYYNPATGIFTFVSQRHPTGEDQWGDIVLGHKSDPDYRVTLPIDQAILVVIPEFDYFVIKYTWSAADVDIQVGFWGNETTVNYRNKNYNCSASNTLNASPSSKTGWVGWNHNNTSTFAGKTVLQWGGDATGGQGETVFFNAKQINAYPYPGGKVAYTKPNGQPGQRAVDVNEPNLLPRVVKLSCCAGWYSGSGTITCTIYCYLGGSMVQSGTNFNNSGGSVVYTTTTTGTTTAKPTSGGGTYLRFCTIEYDRKKHTANVMWDKVTVVNRYKG